MAQSSRTFRIFVSSTFSDLKAERNALQEKVFRAYGTWRPPTAAASRPLTCAGASPEIPHRLVERIYAMADVFISYSRKDIAFARLLHEALTQGKVETWIDWARIPVGEKWWNEISAAIAQSDIFLFIISSHSVGSEVCKKEVDQALSHNKRIIPVIVDDTPEAAIREFVPDLTAINWIIFRRDDVFLLEARPDENLKPEEQMVALPKTPQFRQAVEKLNAAIHTDWGWVKAHTRLETRAQEWDRRKREGSWLLRGKDLGEAEGWLAQVGARKDPQPTDLQRQYVLASRRAESQRQRMTLGFSLGALGIISILLVIAILARQTAQRNLARSESLRLAADADNITTQPDGNVETAVLLSLRALQGGYLPQADAPLQKSLPYLYATHTFSGHTDTVDAVAFSPDGKFVLTGSLDNTAKLWDAATGAEVRTFSGHTGPVESVAFSPDGKYVLTGSRDKTAKLWDAATGALVQTFYDPTNVVRTSVELKRSNHSMAFSPDGKYVLTASDDGTPKLWDAATGALVRTFSGHTNIVRSVAFSPDGNYVLTGGLDDTARLWDAATGAEVYTFEHASWVYSVAFSPDGKYVLTGTSNATLWDTATGVLVRTFTGVANGAIGVAFSPDGSYLLTGSLGQQTAMMWDVTSGALVRTFSGHTDSVDAVAFSPDGKVVLTGSSDRTAKLWDATSSAAVRTFSGHKDIIESVAFSPDGKYVLTGSDDGTAKLWDAATCEVVRTFSGHTDAVWSVAFSPDGKYVLTGSLDKTAKLWEVATGAVVRTFTGHTAPVWSVAFSPDGKYVLTGSQDRTAKLWDAGTGKVVHTFSGHTQGVIGVAFSPDGRYVLTGSIDWDTKLWDATTGAEIRTFKGDSSVEGVAFSPDGKYVLTGNYERTATLWDAATGAAVRTFSGHTGFVGVVAFSPDGKYVLTASGDFTAKLWETATGVEVRTFGGHTDAVTSVAFSPDGKYVLTGSMDKTVELWDTDYRDTIRWACAHLTRDLTPEERTQYFVTDNKPTCPLVVPTLVTPSVEPAASNTTFPGQTTDTFAVEPTSSDIATPLPWTTEVTVSDSFDDNKYGWPVLQQWNDNGNLQDMQVQNGELDWNIDCGLNDGCYYLWVPGGIPAVSDFDLSVDVKRIPETTNGYAGIVFRFVNESNYYMFAYNDADGSFLIWKVVGNSVTSVANWETSSAINSSQFNRLRVEAVGSSFNFFINDIKVYSAEITGISSGMVGVTGGNFSSGKISLVFDNFDLRETTTATAILEVTHYPNPAKFQPGGASGGAYTCAYKTSVKAIGAGVRIEKFGMYFWENNQWVHSTSNNGQPWSPEEFANWYSCPGAYIGPGQECSDPNNWNGADTPNLTKGKWYYIGVDDNGNEVQGEAVIECQP
jgi:WD40 repeat protein